MHVTLRLGRGMPSLRSRRFVREFERRLGGRCERGDFRVLHYSLQRNHAHLIVEADSKKALARGMKSVSARLARTVNQVYRRTGRVLDGRYHPHLLRSPREMKAALAYVLLNARKHWFERFGFAPPVTRDEASSSRWFDGWFGAAPMTSRTSPPVASPRTWLAKSGWRRHGLVDPAAIPGVNA